MRKFFVSVFIFAFCVDMYLSQDETTQGYVTIPNYLNDLEPFSFEDFKKPPKMDDPTICHTPNMECLRNLKSKKPICAFVKNYGLISFSHICDIHLQNCLAQPVGVHYIYGTASKNDIIYYNGKKQSCYYYIKQEKDMNDALRLYYKAGYGKDVDENLDKIGQF